MQAMRNKWGCRTCDCLNECGDDEGLYSLEVRPCETLVQRSASRRMQEWREWEIWWLKYGKPEGLDYRSANAAWNAARHMLRKGSYRGTLPR